MLTLVDIMRQGFMKSKWSIVILEKLNNSQLRTNLTPLVLYFWSWNLQQFLY